MRFGIMEMQMGMLIPDGLPAPEMLARVAGFEHVDLTRKVAESGFHVIELGGDLSLFFPGAYSSAAIQKLAALKQELGLTYTVHLPLWSIEPSTPLAPVRRGSAQVLADIIRATLPLDPEDYVMHATGPLAAEFYRMNLPELARTLILRQFQNNARDSVEWILHETGVPSRKLAIETIEFPFDLTVELAEELDTSICLDTSHILSGFAGIVELFEAIDRCLPRLAQIHLHDAPLWRPGSSIIYGKDHQPLGAGDLNVGKLLDRLAQVNFKGPLILELEVHEALASLDVIHQLRPGMID